MRAPTYQPDQVRTPAPVEARFRAADNGGGVGGAIGRGMQQLGAALNDRAVAQDQIAAQNDDTQARKMVADARVELSSLNAEYGTLQAGEARERQQEYLDRVNAVREKVLTGASTNRMRRFAEELLTPVIGDAGVKISTHAVQQQKVERRAVLGSEQASLAETAARESDPIKRDVLIGELKEARFAEIEELDGYDRTNPAHAAVFEQAGREATSKAHEAVLDRMNADPIPDVSKMVDYIDAYGDEMTSAAVGDYLKSLAPALRDRASRSVANRILDRVRGVTPAEEPASGEAFTFAMPVKGSIPGGGRFDSARDGGKRQHRALDISAPTGTPIYTIAPGKVTKVTPMDGASGNWVEVTHDDGTSSTYSHMNSFAVKVGDRVPAGAQLGEVGNTGRGTGPHLHLVTRDRNGNRVDPETVLGRQGQGRAGGSYGSTPREWDVPAVMATVDEMAAEEGWSPEETEIYRRQVLSQIKDEEGLKREVESDAAEAAAEVVLAKGENFTNTSVIPRNVWNGLSRTDQLRLEDQARDNRERREAVPKFSKRYYELQIEKRLDPTGFASRDLSQEVGKVERGQLGQMLLDQATIAAKPPSRANDYRSGINRAISWGRKYGGVELDDEDFPAVYDTMKAILEGLGRTPTPEDYDAAFNSAVQKEIPTTRRVLGFIPAGSSSTRAFEVDTVPDNFRAQFIRNWRGGGQPTEEQILAGYRRWLIDRN